MCTDADGCTYTHDMEFQRLRESLALILIAVLPMHAMLVTVSTNLLQGQHHAPLLMVAVWKEVLLALIILLALIDIVRGRRRAGKRPVWFLDALDWCIVIGILAAIAASLSRDIMPFVLGFKYDFLPLVAFMVLRRVSWSSLFLVAATRVIVMVGILAAAFGIVTLLLPMDFFTAIGYSDLHSLYRPNAPIASFQFLEGTEIRRIQSFMSGPNHFGVWLLLPIAATFQMLMKSFRERRRMDAALYVSGCVFLLAALFFTYSRSAWIGAGVIVLAVSAVPLWHIVWRRVHRWIALLISGIALGVFVLGGIVLSPQIFLRTQSLRGHVEKPLAAIQTIRAHPFGLGLGTAGPASNRLSDTCVFVSAGADIAWAESRTDLCVFVGDVQKLPVGRTCNCPVLTENWYLQWGVEMGGIGLLVSVMLVFFVLSRASWREHHGSWIFLSFIGVSVAALFLHAWEDAAVALTVWVLLAALMPTATERV